MPPRILIILSEQWPRALLRASLRERGYDAVGAPDLSEALVYPADEPGRGPVRLLILDSRCLGSESDQAAELFGRLRIQHAQPGVLLLADSRAAVPPGPWSAVLRRPIRIADIVHAVKELLPSAQSN